ERRANLRSFQVRLPLRAVLRRNEFRDRRRIPFDNRHEGVKMNRADCGLERSGRTSDPAMYVLGVLPGLLEVIELMRHAMHVGRKWIEHAVHILAEKNAARAQMRQEFLKRGDLLFRMVAAVIDHDIERGHLRAESVPEVSI